MRRVTIAETFDRQFSPNRKTGCREWQRAVQSRGYGHFKKGDKYVLAHREAWERAFGPIPAGKDVLHRCDNRRCGEITHLFLGDDFVNKVDMYRKGRNRHPRLKLDAAKARRIFEQANRPGARISALAVSYGVSRSTIGLIRAKKSWKFALCTT